MPLASFCTQHCVHYPRDNGIICCLAGPGSMLLGCLRAFTQPDDGARPIGASSRLPPCSALFPRFKHVLFSPGAADAFCAYKHVTYLMHVAELYECLLVRATHLIGQAALEHWIRKER
eukprot:scaffold24175_cov19-Tisochrysis_lutea.AAC.1